MATISQALQPFYWGAGGQKKTREEIERERRLADALRAKETPTGPWSLIGALAREGAAAYRGYQADQAEKENKAAADALWQGLGDGYDTNELMSVLGNDYASPAQSAVAQALLQRELTPPDPMDDLNRQLKELQVQQAELDLTQDRDARPDRKYEKDAAGVHRYLDTGEPVFPNVTASTAPNVEGESKLRSEYNTINTVKDFGMQTQAYQRVLDSAKDPSPAGDLALIFNYMKVLDPGSTVREGEFATAQNSGSIPEQIWSRYNQVMSGERLSPSIRTDFVKRAGELFKGAAGLQEKTNERYSGLATEYGYDPSRIVAPIPQIGILDPEFKIEEYVDPQTGQQTAPLPITNDDEYNALPEGATYRAPDGSVRVKGKKSVRVTQ